MTQHFNTRFLLFDDDVCLALFSDNGQHTTILMSANGDFVQISRDSSEMISHLTRFVPSKFSEQIEVLLNFRNSYAHVAFVCERFCSGSDDCYEHEHSTISHCSFNRRVICSSNVYFYPDSVLDLGHYDGSTVHVPCVSRCHRIFAKALAPPSTDAFGEERDKNRFARSAANASAAQDLFNTLGVEIGFMFALDAYPSVTKERFPVFEQVDGCTYALSSNVENTSLEIDAWLSPCNSGTILTLCGDYVKLYCMQGGVPHEEELHLTLVNFNDEHSPQLLTSDYSSVDCFHANRHHIVRMLSLREHLEEQRSVLTEKSKSKNIIADCVLTKDPIVLSVDGIKYTALSRMRRGVTEIYKLHGLFPDHSILELDTESGVINAILNTGDSTKYLLQNCIQAMDGVAGGGDDITKAVERDNREYGTPSHDVVRHVKCLLASQRWTMIPPDQRHSLVTGDQKLSIMAQATVLASQRFLLLQDISNGKICFGPAAEESRIMKKKLHLSGRDLHSNDPRLESQGMEVVEENESLMHQPSPKLDALQYRQVIQKKARTALAETNTFLEESLAFIKSAEQKEE